MAPNTPFSFYKMLLQSPYKDPAPLAGEPPEDLDSVTIAFSMIYNLHGVGKTAFGAKIAKRVKKDLAV